MTYSRVRFECNEMHRLMWVERTRLEKKAVTLTHVLGKFESFRKAMDAKYSSTMSDSVPIQHAARLVMSILTTRLYIGVLHRYHNSVSVRIPDRLRQIILTTGTQQIEHAVELETDPTLAHWKWYSGAFQQYHSALLLLVEIFSYPMRREADRIWKCLDYVFETDRTLTRAQKGRVILTEARDKSGMYRDVRKIRAPVGMMDRLLQKPPRRAGDPTNPNLPMNSANAVEPGAPIATLASAVHTGGGSGVPGLDTSGSTRSWESSDTTLSPPSTFSSWSFDAPSAMFAAPTWYRGSVSKSDAGKSDAASSDSGSAPLNVLPPASNSQEATSPVSRGKDDINMDIDWVCIIISIVAVGSWLTHAQ